MIWRKKHSMQTKIYSYSQYRLFQFDFYEYSSIVGFGSDISDGYVAKGWWRYIFQGYWFRRLRNRECYWWLTTFKHCKNSWAHSTQQYTQKEILTFLRQLDYFFAYFTYHAKSIVFRCEHDLQLSNSKYIMDLLYDEIQHLATTVYWMIQKRCGGGDFNRW